MNTIDINKNWITDKNISVSISLNDLREWYEEVITDTKRQLEENVINEKLEKYLSPKQVGEMLNVNLSTLFRWHKKGYLCPIKIGGKSRYKQSSINLILNERRSAL